MVFEAPHRPGAVEEYVFDMSPYLGDGEVVTSVTIVPSVAAASFGLRIRSDGDYAPPPTDGKTIRFHPEIAEADRDNPHFDGYGVRLPLIVTFETNTQPPRVVPERVELRVRR
jgi:hypothetical protein